MPISRRPPSATWCFTQIALVKLSLAVLGFGRTLSRYERTRRADTGAATTDDTLVERTAHNVAAAAALYPGRALCLEQSLILHRELRRRGIESRLRFGVHASPFAAHSWVQVDGSAVNEVEYNLQLLTPLEG
jgi:hypothetical protein